jgi:O-antigen/teichoic acid export membrane protein
MKSDLPVSRTLVAQVLSRWVGPRGTRILHTGLWSLIAKVTGAANLFVVVPFVLQALGPAQFGAWATLVSLVGFAGFLDFGFGNGTMNLVAAAQGSGRLSEIGIILREGRRTLLLVAILLALAVLILLPLIPWHRLLGMPVTMASQSRWAAAIVLFTVVLAVPLNLASRAQLGLGRGDRAFRWQALGQVATLIIVIGLAKSGAQLVALTAAAVSTPLLSSVANTITLLRDPIALISPHSPRSKDIASHIRHQGSLFFILQLAAALAFLADLPLISALRGPTEAGIYAIVQRLFSVVPMGLALVWTPLWPIYRQALAAGDHPWVLRTLRRSLAIAVMCACAIATLFATCFNYIAILWVHKPVAISSVLLIGFAAWCVIDAAGTAIATFLNAASIMRFQLIVAGAFAITCLTCKVWAIAYLGIDAIPWVTTITYSLISLLPTILLRRRLISSAILKTY